MQKKKKNQQERHTKGQQIEKKGCEKEAIHLEHDALELMSHGLIICDIIALTQATRVL